MEKTTDFIKEVCKSLKEHPEIVTLWSGFSVILVALFRAGAYIYYRGWFEQMNIPICYIEVDYQNVLYQFVIVMIVLFLVFLFSYVYQKCCLRLEQKKGARFFLHVTFIAVVMMGVFGYYVICLLKDYSWSQIYEYLKMKPFDILLYAGAVAILCWIMVRLSGFSIYPVLSYNDRDKRTDECKNEKRTKRTLIIYLAAIVISLSILSGTVYKSGRDRIKLIDKANIVSIDGNTYYIAEENMEWAIVKECVLDEEKLAINEGHYRLTTLMNQNVVVKEIDGGLDDCVMNEKEYRRLYGK